MTSENKNDLSDPVTSRRVAENCGHELKDHQKKSRGLCPTCYRKEWARTGRVTARSTSANDFWERADRSNGPDACWPWTKSVDATGYGRCGFNKKVMRAHQVAFFLEYGYLPTDGNMVIDHACHDPNVCKLGVNCPHRRCVNPKHLREVTQHVNVVLSGGNAAINADKMECDNGHPFSEENTWVHKTSRGRWRRTCITCHNAKQRKYQKELTGILWDCMVCGGTKTAMAFRNGVCSYCNSKKKTVDDAGLWCTPRMAPCGHKTLEIEDDSCVSCYLLSDPTTKRAKSNGPTVAAIIFKFGLQESDGCIPWTGNIQDGVRPTINVGTICFDARRSLWTGMNGGIPSKVELVHEGESRIDCMNLAHFYVKVRGMGR